ncbi:MAG: Crp/Fnr family transcriptional regulator [Bacillota bacterium]|nr:Crp/Fnr family transcriptional regulator [Bacillota bacterium]
MIVKDLVTRLPYWENLLQSEREYVSENTSIRTYEKGALLHGRGEVCMGMIYILAGSVRVHMISDEGREITLFHLNEGDSCILSASCVMSQITFETQMVATEATVILVVNAGAYSSLMEKNLHVRCFTYELASERFSTVVKVMQQILFKGMDSRLASFLLEYSAKAGKNEISLTQEEVAREINSAREVVTRVMKLFSQDNLVEIKRGRITIKNRSGLEEIAGK